MSHEYKTKVRREVGGHKDGKRQWHWLADVWVPGQPTAANSSLHYPRWKLVGYLPTKAEAQKRADDFVAEQSSRNGNGGQS